MPTVPREYEITYGTLTVGGSTDYLIDGAFLFSETPDKAVVEFSIFYGNPTLATFSTLDTTVRTAFLKNRQNFVWNIAGTAFRSYSHTGKTGMDGEPQIVKDEDPTNTGRTRHLRVRIEFTLPFLGAAVGGEDDAGRKGASFEVDYNESRVRTVRVSGTYTALAAVGSARAVYSAKVAALASGFLTSIGGTYNPTGESIKQNDQNTEVTFVRTYEEISASEAGSLDDTAITKQLLVVEVAKSQPGDAGAASQRMTTVRIDYTAFISKDVTTDLKGKWENTIRPWLVNTVVPAYAPGSVALEEEAPRFTAGHAEFRIDVSMTFLVIVNSIILESSVVYTWKRDKGQRWADIHSKPEAGRRYHGPAKFVMIIEKYKKQLRGASAKAVGAAGVGVKDPTADLTSVAPPDPFSFNRMSFIEREDEYRWKPDKIGVADKYFEIEEIWETYTREYKEETTASTGGGGGVTFTR